MNWIDIYLHRKKNLKLPINDRRLYGEVVGLLRTVNIKAVLERELGYLTIIDHPNANEVDVKIFLDDQLIGVMEVTNWLEESWYETYPPYDEKIKNIIANLTSYECTRFLVVSFKNNIKKIGDILPEHKIQPIIFGFQTQVPLWIHHYESECQKKGIPIWEMRANGENILQDIKPILEKHFPNQGMS